MKRINTEGIEVSEMKSAYDTIVKIMDKNNFNYVTAWNHVRSALARAIVEKASKIE